MHLGLCHLLRPLLAILLLLLDRYSPQDVGSGSHNFSISSGGGPCSLKKEVLFSIFHGKELSQTLEVMNLLFMRFKKRGKLWSGV